MINNILAILRGTSPRDLWYSLGPLYSLQSLWLSPLTVQQAIPRIAYKLMGHVEYMGSR
jgi:hypothetical protein